MQKSLSIQQLLQQMPSLMPNFCDRCGAKHNSTDMEVVNQEADKIVCRLGCVNCGSAYVIQINSPVDGMIAAKKSSFKSDVTASEIKKFSFIDQINQDEILDVIIALKEVKTLEDFNVLFDAEINDISIVD